MDCLIIYKARELGIPISSKDPVVMSMLDTIIKEMENRGYQFEGAEASFELMLKKPWDCTASISIFWVSG